jgi:NTP pyrophosphatase (non-canonical NTP hydrolase)
MTRGERLRAQADQALAAQFAAQAKKTRGDLRYLADDLDCPDVMRLAALTEELGEVARCLHDGEGDLALELAQLAGIAIAWASIL